MKNKVTTATILDTRRKKDDGTYPVKLRLTYKGDRQYYGIDESLTKDDYAKVISENPKGNFKEVSLRLAAEEQRAIDIINGMTVFSWDKFKRKFLDEADHSDLFTSLKNQISSLESKGRPGTASTYKNTLNSWEGFLKGKQSPKNKDKEIILPISSITKGMLDDFEDYMVEKGKSLTTVGIYLRNVRRVFNLAIKHGVVKSDLYPFGDDEDDLYTIPEGQNFKRALPKSDIHKIYHYSSLEGSPEQYYRDLWLFSFFCNGMNLADVSRLKYSDIKGDKLVFMRKKTMRRRKKNNGRPDFIVIELTNEKMQIIDKWGVKPKSPDKYIFNILNSGISPADELAQVKQLTKQVNKYIGRIAKSVGIEGKVTSYHARHSFANILKEAGESTEFISEALGHSGLQVTENYLTSFDTSRRKKANKKLIKGIV